MRKITKESAQAFIEGKNYKANNTQVCITRTGKELFLFGNKIAEVVGKKRLYINACGYKTNTTKERLNGLPGVSISQKAGIWYLNGNQWDGNEILVTSDFNR